MKVKLQEIKKWLKKVAIVAKSNIPDDDWDIYISKYDGSYITRVGMERDISFLVERGITDFLQHGVGFSPSKNKWYGWSHRAIYGFTVESTCSKGDCHYFPNSIEDAVENALNFWEEPYHKFTLAKRVSHNKIRIYWIYSDTTPNKKLHNTQNSVDQYIELGRGEWVAKTMEDARQMAIDFNKGVS